MITRDILFRQEKTSLPGQQRVSQYYLRTVGCQMNKADSQRLGEKLEQLGYRPAPTPEAADIIAINSCSVRQSAENRVASHLSSLKPLKRTRPELIIALIGCMVDGDTKALRQRFPHVDLFLRPQIWRELLELAADKGQLDSVGVVTWPKDAPPVTSFVPIIQGCDNFCSYCIVPHRRGRERSRPVEEILCEVRSLVQRGVKEITLLGQNVDSYGHDLPQKPDLAHLLEQLNPIEGLARIRFLTSHPKDMSQRLIDTLARLEKVCEHISLPVQAGDNAILRVMRRGYTVAEYRDLVKCIRLVLPDVALSTDVIVGFPGETEEQFRGTVELLRQLRFDTVHVAAYSPRPGTLASKMLVDNVPATVKRERLQAIESQQEKIATEINSQLVGKELEVLVEGRKGDKWQGRTHTNKLVFFTDSADHRGHLVEVKVEKATAWSLQGK